MLDRRRLSLIHAAAMTMAMALSAAPSPAQDAQEPEQLLKDFSHYVIIRNDELAVASGRALLEMNLSPTEFVAIVEDDPRLRDRFEEQVRRALVIDNVEDTAAQLLELYERGKLDRARDPDEVARNIQLLEGNARARMLARERLDFAGEYAVPQLLQVLQARANPTLENEVTRLLIDMGAKSVVPLATALPRVDGETQRKIAIVLGQTGVRTALPFLYDVYRTRDLSRDTSRAFERAIEALDGGPRANVEVADLYLDLAESYYKELTSLTRFQGESHQLLWEYDPGFGLFPTAIRTPVFHEAMAMRLLEKALEMQPGADRAASVWLAANFSRQIDQDPEYENPVYGADRRDPQYFAVAAGPRLTGQVLSRALTDRDTPLARRALAALRRTTGGAGEWQVRSLLEALSYPDRRVQYEAALAIAEARPQTSFAGADRVVPTLAAAVRDADKRFAVVIATELQRRQDLAEHLRGLGFEVLSPATSLTDIAQEVAEAPGVDLIVADVGQSAVEELVRRARSDAKLRVSPVLALLPGLGEAELSRKYTGDPLTTTARQGVSDAELDAAVESLLLEAAGEPVDESEALRYAGEALSSLRDLAISGNSVLDVSVAARPLIAAMQEQPSLRPVIADVLANLEVTAAQQALMDAALSAEGQDRVTFLNLTARSVRSNGNLLNNRQVDRLVRTASDTGLEEDVATAAAALMGALNLDRGDGVASLILSAGERGEGEQ